MAYYNHVLYVVDASNSALRAITSILVTGATATAVSTVAPVQAARGIAIIPSLHGVITFNTASRGMDLVSLDDGTKKRCHHTVHDPLSLRKTHSVFTADSHPMWVTRLLVQDA